jgi:hypothetical protein
VLRQQNLLSLALSLSLTACTVYDSERGTFVSSTVQSVEVKAPADKESTIYLLQFNPPASQIVGRETRWIGPAFGSVNFEYRFDEVDQVHLRESILGSFKKYTTVKVQDLPANAGVDGLKGTVIGIFFNEAGIVSDGSSKCIIDTEVYIDRNGIRSTKPIRVEGDSAMSVAAAKNDAIRKYIIKLSQAISEG